MRILVCVKQVPDTAEIKIDPVTNTLIRAGVPSTAQFMFFIDTSFILQVNYPLSKANGLPASQTS